MARWIAQVDSAEVDTAEAEAHEAGPAPLSRMRACAPLAPALFGARRGQVGVGRRKPARIPASPLASRGTMPVAVAIWIGIFQEFFLQPLMERRNGTH
jgi:hypothetical protein